MKPAVKYWVFIFAIALAVFGIIFGSFYASWIHLTPEEQFFVGEFRDKLLIYPIAGVLLLFLVIAALVSFLFQFFVFPLLKLGEELRIITEVNAKHRIKRRGAKEVMHVTDIINLHADRYLALEADVKKIVKKAKEDLEEERHRLAALMSELPNGVLVCNLDGQILLYNQQAQQLLEHESVKNHEIQSTGGLIGLGRSIFGILDRGSIVHALDYLHQRIESGQSAPISRFVVTVHAEQFMRVNMAPVTQENGSQEITGFVLTLDDITHQIEADSRRDNLLQLLADGLQGSLENIRGAISTILSKPELTMDQLGIHRQKIDDASLNIQEQLQHAQAEYAKHLRWLGRLEDILAGDLLKVLEKNIREKLKIKSQVDVEKGLWLKIDSYSIVQGVMFLITQLSKKLNIPKVSLQLEGQGHFALLSVKWKGPAIDIKTIEDWEEQAIITDDGERPFCLRSVIENSGGKICDRYSACDAKTPCIQFLLPAAQPESNWQVHESSVSRPINYEFNLFEQQGQTPELDDISLSQLTCIVFDTETTGLNPSRGDEIISIGALRLVNGRLLREEVLEQLIDPKRSISKESIEITGIKPEMLRGEPTIDQVLPRFYRFAEDSVLVAHNAAFDMRFLQMKEDSTGIQFTQPVLDTLLLSAVVHPHQEVHSLDEIAKRLGVKVIGRHTALGDAIVTGEVFLKLIPLLEAKGIYTLGQARQASASSKFAKVSY